MDPVRAQGQWWLPDGSNKRVVGQVEFNPKDGIILDLVGERLGDPGSNTNEAWSAPVIFGLIPGREVTLLEALKMPTAGSHPGPGTERLRAEHILVGGNTTTNAFDRCAVRISLLDEWSQFGGIDLPNGGAVGDLGFTYIRPEPYRAILGDAVELQLRPVARESHSLTEHMISLAAWWQLDFPEPKHLEEIERKYLDPLQDLLSLATDQPIAIRYFELWNSLDEPVIPYRVGRQWAYAPETQPRVAIPLFTAKQFDFTTCVPAWFRLCDELSDVRALVFSDRYLGPLPVDTMVTNMAGAAEALHRATGAADSSDLLEQMRTHVDALVDAAPVEERDSVRGFLRHTYDPSLKRRLIELVDKVGPRATSITGDDISRWASVVRDTRDGLTHRSGAIPSRRVDSLVMLGLATGLEVLVTTRLMQLLGIDESQIDDAWSVSPRCRYAHDLAERYVLPGILSLRKTVVRPT
jgi:hypothetical protein